MDRRKIYLADMLSLLRVFSVIAVLLFAYAGMWTAAYTTLVIGWGTDLLDGLAARKYGSYRDEHPDFDADGLADSALAFGASLVPVSYAIHHTGWLSLLSIALITIFAMTVISAIWMVLIMNGPKTPLNRKIVAVNMIVMHGIVQIAAVTLWFAYMAFGYGFVFGLTVDILVACAIYQLPKMRGWWKGRLTAA